MDPASFRVRQNFDNVESQGEWHQIVTDGGMGDLICALVAVDYNVRHFKKVKFHVWVPDYLHLFARHVLPKGTSIRPFSMAEKEFRHDILGMTTEWVTNHTCMRTHPVDYAFHMLSDRHIYDLNEKNYLQVCAEKIDVSEFDLPRNYVTLAATSVEPIRTMPAETANAIIEFCTQRDWPVVFIGKDTPSSCGFKDFAIKGKPIEVDFDNGINLINKTSLLQTAKIINDSKAFIGMDGGLLHVAGCTDANIVCGFTASDPIHVAPIRKGSQYYKFFAIEPDAGIPNRYFQTWGSFQKGNFQRFEGWEKVVADMTPDKFIKVLERIL